jgi:hypothetical protein
MNRFSNRSATIFVLLPFALVGCKKSAAADDSAGAKPAAQACGYKSPSGFCLTPPAGFTTKEHTADQGVPGTEFIKPDEPKPQQNLFVDFIDAELDARALALQRGNFTSNVKIVEDTKLAGEKGFYLLSESSNGVHAVAMLAGKGKTFTCRINAQLKDKAALEPWLQACKSLRVAE